MPKREAQAGLRFAGLCRVSTERQAKEGESLGTQKAAIETTVTQLGGTVTAWYGGQEHGTPGHEKKEINRLLADAKKPGRPWDAVMVTRTDRWSRDNQTSKAGLEIFQAHNVRFFARGTEYDLFNPTARFFLGVSAEVGEFVAAEGASNSIENRIKAAERGVPTGGHLPYGRTFDKKTETWGIDREKRRKIQAIAKRYLAGESMARLAELNGLKHCTLHKNLMRRCGPEWILEFHSPRFNIIHRKIKIKVPPLLPPETIKALRKRAEANKTYDHGPIKHPYLLRSLLLCESCGHAIFGRTDKKTNRQSYQHAYKKDRPCKARHVTLRADEIENAVLQRLFDELGNPAGVKRAIEAAIPNPEAVSEMRTQLESLGNMIDKEREGRRRVLRLVKREACTEDEAERDLKESMETIALYEQELERLHAELENTPTPTQIRAVAEDVCSRFKRKRPTPADVRLNATKGVLNSDFSRMTWKDKKALLHQVFGGKTADGKRCGIYISWDKSGKGYRWTMRGDIIQGSGIEPGTDGQDDLTTKSATL